MSKNDEWLPTSWPRDVCNNIAPLSIRSSSNKHVSKLQGKSTFKDSRKDAEDQIYEQIKRKIDESIELANYDWQATEAKGTASAYMLDLIAFLNNVFQAFTNLPVSTLIQEFSQKETFPIWSSSRYATYNEPIISMTWSKSPFSFMMGLLGSRCAKEITVGVFPYEIVAKEKRSEFVLSWNLQFQFGTACDFEFRSLSVIQSATANH